MNKNLMAIGVMTGNSLDAVDVVLTLFEESGKIKDLEFYSLSLPEGLFKKLKDLRSYINECDGDMAEVSSSYTGFNDVLNEYMNLVSKTVLGLIEKSEYEVSDIDIIGFHGQTCAHKPPFYTVQIGDGQMLANATGIPVVYDFRSDDVMNGGQGAPFAPKHNEHCAEVLKETNDFPIAFINGGNTSNIAHSTYNTKGEIVLAGWDAGPFNHFIDMLIRKYTDKTCDFDGEVGKRGRINTELLKELFYNAAVNIKGDNFLLDKPAKSSDPQWYKLTPMLEDDNISLYDKVRTVEYFAAYLTYHSLGHTDEDFVMPSNFAIFGGGWKNPIVRHDFESLIFGQFDALPILEEHKEWFQNINKRITANDCIIKVKWSDSYGFNAEAMEARIFADMARCYLENIPFTSYNTTGVKRPVRCGIIAYPNENEVSNALKWSRASAGWDKFMREVS